MKPSTQSHFSTPFLPSSPMWIPWMIKSPSRVRYTLPNSTPEFRCSSFRDVQSLIDEDDVDAVASLDPPNSPIHRCSLLRRVRTSLLRLHRRRRPPPDSQDRIVVYYTSLRVVRRTFEDCRAVRSILNSSFRRTTAIDERDLFMDPSFLPELQGILLDPHAAAGGTTDFAIGDLKLPRVFIDGKYVGGVDEISALHESGELKRMIGRLPLNEKPAGVCGDCGGHRFLVCDWCCGSHKVYTEESGFMMCDMCNENGMIKCPSCTSVLF